jgi:hypothetical protein
MYPLVLGYIALQACNHQQHMPNRTLVGLVKNGNQTIAKMVARGGSVTSSKET